MDRMSSPAPVPSLCRERFLDRVARAVAYIRQNGGREVPLPELAEVSGLSEAYLDRVIFDLVGATPRQIAKAVRDDPEAAHRPPQHPGSPTGLEVPLSMGTFTNAEGHPQWTMQTHSFGEVAVRLVEMPDMSLACVRYIGQYMGVGQAFRLLYCWALENRLMTPESLVLGLYHDCPGDTAPEELRSDACLTVPPGTEPSVPVTIRALASRGTYACGRFVFRDARNFPLAWKTMTAGWLPASGLQFDNRPVFEIYRGDPLMLDDTFRIDVCLPVKPL
jgi:DNA gyrase inhibitor GyrI